MKLDFKSSDHMSYYNNAVNETKVKNLDHVSHYEGVKETRGNEFSKGRTT